GIIRQLVTGAAIGDIAAVIMLAPIQYAPGIAFATRTVLISLSGLFYGVIPTLLAGVAAALVRIHLGGDGVMVGVLTIVLAAATGLSWRAVRRPSLDRISLTELYVFGCTVHVLVVALLYIVPEPRFTSFGHLALAILLLFPVITLLL